MDIDVNRNGYTCVRARIKESNVQLIGYGDLHAGSLTYNEKKALEIRDYIKEENCIWIGMGDFVESATRHSVGSGVYQQKMNPNEQIKYLRNLLDPIKDKCMGIIKGNHEERIFKDDGVDIADIICYELGIPYCIWEFFGIIVQDSMAYGIYAIHSYTSNRTGGLALNSTEQNIEKMIGNIEIIMRGHTHKNIVHIAEYFEIDKINNTVDVKPRVNLITGHYLDRDKSYAAAQPLRGDPPGTIALELELNRHKSKKIRPIYL